MLRDHEEKNLVADRTSIILDYRGNKLPNVKTEDLDWRTKQSLYEQLYACFHPNNISSL